MKTSFTFRGMETSPTIEKYVEEKIQKLDRMLKRERDPISLEVILESHPTHAQTAIELRLHSVDYHLRAQEQGTDLYGIIDKCVDVLVGEVRRKKEKRIDARKEAKPEPE
jgi:ribosomal subunit interface protein